MAFMRSSVRSRPAPPAPPSSLSPPNQKVVDMYYDMVYTLDIIVFISVGIGD